MEAFDVAALAEDFGIRDLRKRLTDAGVALIEGDDDSCVIPVRSWRSYVRSLILGSHEDPAMKSGVSAPSPLDATTKRQWGARVENFLTSHPQTRELIEKFVQRFLSDIKGGRAKQNETAITLILPDGGQAGLRPEARSFKLSAQRGQGDGTMQLHERRVSDEGEFQEAIDWLKDLPPYESTRVWRTRR